MCRVHVGLLYLSCGPTELLAVSRRTFVVEAPALREHSRWIAQNDQIHLTAERKTYDHQASFARGHYVFDANGVRLVHGREKA
jgi:hypothetical protein